MFNIRKRRLAMMLGAIAITAGTLGSVDAAAGQYRRSARDVAAEAQLKVLIAQLEAITKAQPPRPAPSLPAGCEPFRGPLLAPNVRSAIPTNNACRTPEERQFAYRVDGRTIEAGMSGSARSVCEQRRAAQPYGPNGTINEGWHNTVVGPRMNTCY